METLSGLYTQLLLKMIQHNFSAAETTPKL